MKSVEPKELQQLAKSYYVSQQKPSSGNHHFHSIEINLISNQVIIYLSISIGLDKAKPSEHDKEARHLVLIRDEVTG